MELHESKKTIRIGKQLFHDFEEKAVDADIVIPDYCPEVTAVLKCTMHPVVTARFQSGDRYSVDGVTMLRILYMSEDRVRVYCHELTQPFSVSFRCSEAVHHQVEIKNDYVNCRATGPRRFDVHGAFRVCLTAIGTSDVEVFADPQMNGVFCQTVPVVCTVPLCEAEKAFMIDETIELGVKTDRLLYGDITVDSCEYKALNHKMIVKGVLGIKAVCAQEDMTTTVHHEMPFSQIVDVDGLNDGWCCEVAVRVGESECYLQSDERGGSVLCVRSKLCACVYCGQNEDADVVVDAYSAEFPLACETAPLQITTKGNVYAVRRIVEQTVTVPEGVVTLRDVWGELKSCENKGDGVLSCCVLVGMIAADEDGQPRYYERTMDCEIVCDDADRDQARVVRVDGTLTDGGMRVRADLEIHCCENESKHLSVVVNVVGDTKRTFAKSPAAIRIVYASAGETLWDIAKRHHANVEDILAENGLSDSVLASETMLMIPML